MRTTTTSEANTLEAKDRNVFVRVRVQNASGTWKILTDGSVGDTNWLDEIDFGENIDQPVSQATYRLHKYQTATNTLAPLATGSAINVNDGGAYQALVDAGRRTDVSVAVLPATATGATATQFHTLFDGEIDGVEWGGEQVRVRARDRLMSHMADRWVESVRRYGSASGTPVETVIGDILTDWTDGRVTLHTPTSPSFLISPAYNQQQMSVLDSSTQLAQLTGWDLRSKWTATAGAFRVNFFEPDRTPTATVAWSFAASDVLQVDKLDVDRAQIRNAVEVEYPSSTATNGRATLEVTATDSIDRFGRRWMKISEPADSPINTAAEAGTFASAALKDQKDPVADHVLTVDLFWPVEVQDYLGFETDDRWYSAKQNLGVYGYRHRMSKDEATTSLMVRGTPAGQYKRWKPWQTPIDPEQRRRKTPTVAARVAQSGATGSVDLVIQDPDHTVTKTEFAKRTSATGGFGSFATTWDRSSGSVGATGRITRGENVTVVSKHNVALRWRITHGDNELGSQTLEGVEVFDSDFLSEIVGVEWDRTATGEVELEVRGDEDTSNVYVIAATATGQLSDPTATSSLTFSGRSGSISTGISPAVGGRVFARVRGANSNGDLGPIYQTRSRRADVDVPAEKFTAAEAEFTGSQGINLSNAGGGQVFGQNGLELTSAGGNILLRSTFATGEVEVSSVGHVDVRSAGGDIQIDATNDEVHIQVGAEDRVVVGDTSILFRTDNSFALFTLSEPTLTNRTGMSVIWYDGSSLQGPNPVQVGAADSGGSGFRMLRIAN